MVDMHKAEEPIRFVITGTIATAIQYVVYYIMMETVAISIAWTIGYIVSFVCNYIMTTYFTFKVKPNRKKALGFAFCHLVNWALQVITLHFFVWLGCGKAWAPIPMYMVCMPVNFLMVRFFVKQKGN